MADKIVIKGVGVYDGTYDLDISYFTNRELHTIKRMTGIRAGELEEAVQAGDNDIVVAMAVIALQRSNQGVVDEDKIWDAEGGKIDYLPEVEEVAVGDASPPDLTTTPSGSGESSAATSGHPENGQSPTGALPSAIGAISDPPISAI